jgi:hypothetical protein
MTQLRIQEQAVSQTSRSGKATLDILAIVPKVILKGRISPSEYLIVRFLTLLGIVLLAMIDGHLTSDLAIFVNGQLRPYN